MTTGAAGSFWMWWWRVRAPAAAKVSATLVAVALLAFGGYLAADRLDGAVAAASEVEILTVRKLVTVHERGVVVARPIRVVHNGGRTVSVTHVVHDTVTTPGKTTVITSRELGKVPAGRQKLVTVAAEPTTVVVTRVGTVTNQQVVTTEHVVTADRVVTQPVTTTGP